MPVDGLHAAREVLRKPEAPPVLDDLKDPYRRLVKAVSGLNEQATGPADIAILVRHVLRHEDERHGRRHVQRLRVPEQSGWPDQPLRRRHGLTTDVSGRVRAEPWRPSWLSGGSETVPAQGAFAHKTRRAFQPVAGDPFLAELDLEGRTYRNKGQREAMRAVLTAPPGATLMINLPTGAGKSLCVQLPALLKARPKGVTAIVVPTVALAIDQERALHEISDVTHPLAYYSGSSEQHDARNEKIRQRIRDGRQKIVFTSPEGLMGALRPALYRAAELGLLKMLVVDEAHTVDQWGNDFRPAFQQIAGLRRRLLHVSDKLFATLLLSATLTEAVIDTLETLFGEPGPFRVTSAARLRPEPSYWFGYCYGEEQRTDRVLEAVDHLPRPLILYATERADARAWARRLRQRDYKRLACVTGDTPSEERRQILRQWRDDDIDLVTATSAFGLGVDKANVRAVLHACVPESVDRFYQEVGRGGRDGKASVSLVLYTRKDYKTAAPLNQPRLITEELGLERWRAMFDKSARMPSGRFRVPIDAIRQTDLQGTYNEAWNVRTLNLMSRAALIQLDDELPPRPPENEEIDEEAFLQELERDRLSCVVEIKNHRHLDASVWGEHVASMREKVLEANRSNFDAMCAVLKGERCVADIFAETYTVDSPDADLRNTSVPHQGISVAKACGGCPVCRQMNREPFGNPLAPSYPVWEGGSLGHIPVLDALFCGTPLLAIFHDAEDRRRGWARQRSRLLRWFVEQGARSVVASQEALEALGEELKGCFEPAFFFQDPLAFFDSMETLYLPNMPHVVVHPDEGSVPVAYLNANGGAPRILLLPSSAADPRRPDRHLQDMLHVSYSFKAFHAEVDL